MDGEHDALVRATAPQAGRKSGEAVRSVRGRPIRRQLVTAVREPRRKSAPPTMAASPPTAPLRVLKDLFARLHDADIRYCHWKSNEHLDASLVGTTDVDVLVDRRAIVPFTRILGQSHFKRFVVKPGRGYP